MNLFEVIPSNLFSILNSKNKNIYVSSLFLIRKVFKQELLIDKDVLTQQLISVLSKELLQMDLEEEQSSSDGIRINKDASSLAHFVIRKLKETGWIESEYGVDTAFKEFIALPPYSIKIINTLHDIILEDEQGYNAYMYSIFSNLIQADNERKDFMYAALLNAYDRTGELENELKTLYHNIRRRYNKLSFISSVNEILVDHFDEYQKKIIKQVYMPLKTKDSLNRFKGNIVQILLKWMRNPIIMEQIEKQAFSFKSFKDVDEVKEEIITKIYFIVDKLNELEDMIEKIDNKNKDYVSATTEKMKFLINKDTSVRAKISKLNDWLASDYDQEKFNESFNELLYLNRQSYIDDSSLFIRSSPKVISNSEPLEIDFSDSYAHIDQMASGFIENMNNNYSHKNVISYVENKMHNQNELESENLNIDGDEELILSIHSLLKGWDKNIFYKIELSDGKVDSNQYKIPNMKYIRRRKL